MNLAGAHRSAFVRLADGVLGSAWGRVAAPRVCRPLPLPAGVVTLAVGGATLGGSGKTPLALACALHAARSGVRVALVGHAYRATPGRARVVGFEGVTVVGDEAVACARAARRTSEREGLFLSVVVGPSRREAMELAVRSGAQVLVFDGLAQSSPRRVDLALLALDAGAPWGSATFPPFGDLRAPIASLLSACDVAVAIGGLVDREAMAIILAHRELATAQPRSLGATMPDTEGRDGALVPWLELQSRRVGLLTALARPQRVKRWLRQHGVHPVAELAVRDHHPFSFAAIRSLSNRHPDIDAWLTTAKCGAALPPILESRPVLTLEYELDLPSALARKIEGLLPRAS